MTAKPNYDPPPDEFPRKGPSSGSGGTVLYSVEARLAYYEPRLVCGQLLDLRWRTLHFEKSPIGVPPHRTYDIGAFATGLKSYQAAQALRWWFLAQAEIEFGCGCVETRLIEHNVHYTYSSEATRAVCVIGAGDDRSNIMPVERSE